MNRAIRLAYRIAHRVRHRWRIWRGTRLEGVTMIATDLEGQLLLIRHSYGPGGWAFPGGGIKPGEAPVDAARRELAEETGCAVDRIEPVGQLEETLSGSPHTAHIFAGTTSDVPRPDEREVVEARFFPAHSLPEPLTRRTRARLEFWRTSRR